METKKTTSTKTKSNRDTLGRMKIHLYTDGACSDNGKPTAIGGWAYLAYYLNDKGERIERIKSGGIKSTKQHRMTNNQMELMAVVKGLSIIKKPAIIWVHTDSKYIANCFKNKWYENWQKNGWKNSQKEPVANRELWEELLDLTFHRRHKIIWQWVKGHDTDMNNNKVDGLAVAAREALRD